MTTRVEPPLIRLEPWTDADLDLERRCNIPEMTSHLGGVESEEQILARHRRFMELGPSGRGRMFRVVLEPELDAVGSVGYWERMWRDASVYEMGWKILPAFQGRGIAAVATAAAADQARAEARHSQVHAFPSVANAASNAVCRKVGFVLVGECDFEYPKGSMMRCNDWRLDLTGRS